MTQVNVNPNYWLVAVVSTVEFALMFLLLWGLILLPLTMCRYLAAELSRTSAARWLPLAHLTDFHKFVGTHLVFQLVLVRHRVGREGPRPVSQGRRVGGSVDPLVPYESLCSCAPCC